MELFVAWESVETALIASDDSSGPIRGLVRGVKQDYFAVYAFAIVGGHWGSLFSLEFIHAGSFQHSIMPVSWELSGGQAWKRGSCRASCKIGRAHV